MAILKGLADKGQEAHAFRWPLEKRKRIFCGGEGNGDSLTYVSHLLRLIQMALVRSQQAQCRVIDRPSEAVFFLFSEVGTGPGLCSPEPVWILCGLLESSGISSQCSRGATDGHTSYHLPQSSWGEFLQDQCRYGSCSIT